MQVLNEGSLGQYEWCSFARTDFYVIKVRILKGLIPMTTPKLTSLTDFAKANLIGTIRIVSNAHRDGLWLEHNTDESVEDTKLWIDMDSGMLDFLPNNLLGKVSGNSWTWDRLSGKPTDFDDSIIHELVVYARNEDPKRPRNLRDIGMEIEHYTGKLYSISYEHCGQTLCDEYGDWLTWEDAYSHVGKCLGKLSADELQSIQKLQVKETDWQEGQSSDCCAREVNRESFKWVRHENQ